MEPIDLWRVCLRASLEETLGPGAYEVALSRIEGAHFYTNAAFLFPTEEVLRACPAGFTAEVRGRYVNYRVDEALLRRAMTQLAERKREDPAPAPGMPSRLEALLRLREGDGTWSKEARTLAWALARAPYIPPKERQNTLTDAFEDYYRKGRLDHTLVRALAFRLQEE